MAIDLSSHKNEISIFITKIMGLFGPDKQAILSALECLKNQTSPRILSTTKDLRNAQISLLTDFYEVFNKDGQSRELRAFAIESIKAVIAELTDEVILKRLGSHYYEMINDHIQKIMLAFAPDVSLALEALMSFPADIEADMSCPDTPTSFCEKYVTSSKSDIDEAVKTLQVETVKDLYYLYENPHEYVQNPADYELFKALIRRNIDHKINSLVRLPSLKTEGERLLQVKEETHAEGERYRALVATRRAPTATDEAHVLFEIPEIYHPLYRAFPESSGLLTEFRESDTRHRDWLNGATPHAELLSNRIFLSYMMDEIASPYALIKLFETEGLCRTWDLHIEEHPRFRQQMLEVLEELSDVFKSGRLHFHDFFIHSVDGTVHKRFNIKQWRIIHQLRGLLKNGLVDFNDIEAIQYDKSAFLLNKYQNEILKKTSSRIANNLNETLKIQYADGTYSFHGYDRLDDLIKAKVVDPEWLFLNKVAGLEDKLSLFSDLLLAHTLSFKEVIESETVNLDFFGFALAQKWNLSLELIKNLPNEIKTKSKQLEKLPCEVIINLNQEFFDAPDDEVSKEVKDAVMDLITKNILMGEIASVEFGFNDDKSIQTLTIEVVGFKDPIKVAITKRSLGCDLLIK